MAKERMLLFRVACIVPASMTAAEAKEHIKLAINSNRGQYSEHPEDERYRFECSSVQSMRP